jgi:hypothetical protein
LDQFICLGVHAPNAMAISASESKVRIAGLAKKVAALLAANDLPGTERGWKEAKGFISLPPLGAV